MRKRFIAGNWKMNKTSREALDFMNDFKEMVSDVNDVDIVLCVPFTFLPLVFDECKGTNIKVCAQNLFYEESGAYTGEVSGSMVKEFAEHVIVGHSERRNIFGENDETINKKIKAALHSGLNVIFCLGERLEERESGKTMDVVISQLKKGLDGISNEDMKRIVVAYEPVWAIGTGKTATPEQAEEVHLALRNSLNELYGNLADEIRIIYGGSVKPDNATEILKKENIDGCLPGGASLKADSFAAIIKA